MTSDSPRGPAIDKASFACPYCGAIAHQRWGRTLVDWIDDGHFPVIRMNSPDVQTWLKTIKNDANVLKQINDLVSKLKFGQVFLDDRGTNGSGRKIENLHLSECYSCKSIAIWRHDRLLYPGQFQTQASHRDMPEDIATDFQEARAVFDASPRASAALLRLCVQKLCKHLGELGQHIDTDIANLVKKGLSPRIQKALDTVRVTGNEVVHPGVINLEDDRDLAASLFTMVNLIVEEMISRPKHVDEMYAKLPQSKRDAIEARDKFKEPKVK